MKKLTFLSIFIVTLCLHGCGDASSSESNPDVSSEETSGEQRQSQVWTRICEDEPRSNCGYTDASGNIKIPIGKYLYLFTEEFVERAIVLKEGAGFVVINKQEEVLMEVFNYDNGPDNPSGGLFRIIGNDGKIGYASELEMTVAIEPAYRGAKPFENGYAAVCPDCTKEVINEYEVLVGKWGIINSSGAVIIKPIYDWIDEIRANKTAIVQLGDDKKKIQL